MQDQTTPRPPPPPDINQSDLKVLPSYLWYQTDVNVAEVLALHFELELPEGFDEGHTLDVAHSAS